MSLSPWDEAGYFQTPLANTVFVGSSAVVLVPADPTRVFLTFSNMTASTFAVLTPKQSIATTGTLFLAGGATIILNYDWWGPLTQIAWFGFSSGGTTVGVQTVSLAKFPKGEKNDLWKQIASLSTAIQSLTDYLKSAVAVKQS